MSLRQIDWLGIFDVSPHYNHRKSIRSGSLTRESLVSDWGTAVETFR